MPNWHSNSASSCILKFVLSGFNLLCRVFFLLKMNPAAKTVAFAKLFLLNFELWQGKVVVVELGGLSIFAAELILGGKKLDTTK